MMDNLQWTGKKILVHSTRGIGIIKKGNIITVNGMTGRILTINGLDSNCTTQWAIPNFRIQMDGGFSDWEIIEENQESEYEIF